MNQLVLHLCILSTCFSWWIVELLPVIKTSGCCTRVSGVQLAALGWEYYLLGEELSAEYRGVYVRNRAVELFCHLLAENQVVVVTDAADVLVLTGPNEYAEAFTTVQVSVFFNVYKMQVLLRWVQAMVCEEPLRPISKKFRALRKNSCNFMRCGQQRSTRLCSWCRMMSRSGFRLSLCSIGPCASRPFNSTSEKDGEQVAGQIFSVFTRLLLV